jgi:predicted RNase H-like HicB family nuclease
MKGASTNNRQRTVCGLIFFLSVLQGFALVTFPDFPEARTDGETLEEALAEAADCLAEAVAGRIARTETPPKHSELLRRSEAKRSRASSSAGSDSADAASQASRATLTTGRLS